MLTKTKTTRTTNEDERENAYASPPFAKLPVCSASEGKTFHVHPGARQANGALQGEAFAHAKASGNTVPERRVEGAAIFRERSTALPFPDCKRNLRANGVTVRK